jgi:ABC-type transport system involved in cytochrome c biogenesis permease component
LSVRWLLLKDLQILRRSPLLVGLLVAYGLLIGALIGVGLSRPETKPNVAFLNQIPPGQTKVNLGSVTIDANDYIKRLFSTVNPIYVHSRQEAIAKVKSGAVTAAVVIPANITGRLQQLIDVPGSGKPPTVDVYFSNADPIKRQGVETRINSRLADANNAIGQQIIQLATGDLNVLLNGGDVDLGPIDLKFLGLRKAQQVLAQAQAQEKDPKVRAAIHRVLVFAQRGTTGLNFAGPALATITQPLRAHKIAVGGRRVSLTDFGIAVAPAVTLMFVGILLGAGMLAMEREENAFGRLVRGLVSRWGLLGEKVALAAIGGLVVALLELAMISIFVPLEWGRLGQWLLGLIVGGLAFGAVGTLIGAVTRDVRAASLLAFMIALPFAFLGFISAGEVSSGLYDIIRIVSALFPFRATLQAMNAAINAAPPALAESLAHLAALIAGYVVLGRLALRRFG